MKQIDTNRRNRNVFKYNPIPPIITLFIYMLIYIGVMVLLKKLIPIFCSSYSDPILLICRGCFWIVFIIYIIAFLSHIKDKLRITDFAIIYYSGLWTKKETFIPFGNIETASKMSNPIQNIFGTRTIIITTIGDSSPIFCQYIQNGDKILKIIKYVYSS